MKILNCPIRGEIKVNNNAPEEIKRIEFVNILLSKGWPKDKIKFEKAIKLGNAGRNKIIADVVAYDSKGKLILVAEIKANSKDKKSAVENQLLKYMRLAKTKYGVYYDGVQNSFYIDDDEESFKELNFAKLFDYKNTKIETANLYFEDLRIIDEPVQILDTIDQVLHNSAITKSERYKVLNTLLFMKIFDEETSTKERSTLKFSSSKLRQMDDLHDNIRNDLNTSQKSQILSNISKNWEIISNIAKILEEFSIRKSGGFVQKYFMKFGPSMLKQSHDQYYTPWEIVNFITSLFKIQPTTKIIDPAGGTGDFLVSAFQSMQINAQNMSFENMNNISYRDISTDPKFLAELNFRMLGVKSIDMKKEDSIKKLNSDKGKYDIVFTNPPFGIKTTYSGKQDDLNKYELKSKYDAKQHDQLGLLFVERAFKLLKDGGVCAIILPSGYMSNPSLKRFREWLINKTRLIGVIGLPPGTFKSASTGVKTDIVIFEKNSKEKNIDIFVDEAINVGFDFKNKNVPTIYERSEKNGDFVYKDNKKVIKTDLEQIKYKFMKFAFDNNLSNIFNKGNIIIEYNTLKVNEYSIKPLRGLKKNKELINKLESLIKYKKAIQIRTSNWELQDSSGNIEKIASDTYKFVPLKSAKKGFYSEKNKLKGWQLPDRAKQIAKKDDIFVSRLSGSKYKFIYIFDDDSKLRVTNAMARIRIKDKNQRLSLFYYLFQEEFWIQQELATNGSIMDTASLESLSKIIVPIASNDSEKKKIDKKFREAKKTHDFYNDK